MIHSLVRLKFRIEAKIKHKIPYVYAIIKKYQKWKSIHTNISLRTIPFLYLEPIVQSDIIPEPYNIIMEYYLNHQFDIMGSNWISFNVNEDENNRYKKIAWNRDFKSKFIWENKNNNICHYETPIKVDVKNVWELGRLQHLVRIALLAYATRKKELFKEYKNQLIDFMDANPAYEGIQWICSMDVAIRAMNILYSYDVLKQADQYGILDEKFDNALQKYVYMHGYFIINNLEFIRGSKINHNHYYTDIVGLLFISAYFRNKKWYKFAKNEFIRESKGQFMRDGTNIEGSTCYHKFCHELLQLGISILLREDKICDEELPLILSKSDYYLKCIANNLFNIPQFGDNDSGTVFNISFEITQNTNFLRHNTHNIKPSNKRTLALTGIKEQYDTNVLSEYYFIRSISNNNKIILPTIKSITFADEDIKIIKRNYTITHKFIGADLRNSSTGWNLFMDTGIIVFKSSNAYLCVNIGKKDRKKFMGHLHDDVLHMDIILNNINYILDPGTAVYTGDIDLRNQFRSSKMHFIPYYKDKMDSCFADPFEYTRNCYGSIISCSKYCIHLTKTMEEIIHHRYISIQEDYVSVIDTSDFYFEIDTLTEEYWYSDNYGSIIKCKRNLNNIIVKKN